MKVVLFFSVLFCFVLGHERLIQTHLSNQKSQNSAEHWAVQLKEGVNPSEFGRKHGFEHVKEHHTHRNVHKFQKLNNGNVETLQSSAEVIWSERQESSFKYKRLGRPSDPFFNSQWHLADYPNKDLNTLPAWSMGFTGKGITIAVVDDGLQSTHPDLSPNYLGELSYDYNSHDPNPDPNENDSHGTEAAGVAAAATNSVCGVGVAPEAGLAGIRLIAGEIDDFTESLGLAHKSDQIDIYTCSWGPQDDGRRLMAPGTLSWMSMENNIKNGREGKGSIMVWAAGNGRGNGDNCNNDGYANSRYTIAIGSMDIGGVQAWYSEDCAMLLGVTPSSGRGRNIFTTDLRGHNGASPDDCSQTFGGTSASSPMGAGVVALVLQQRPDLTWRDVQGVLINSAVLVDSSNSSWVRTGANLYFSHKYGFGKLDATRAIQKAANWALLPGYFSVTCGNTVGSDLSSTLTQARCTIDSPGMIVEHVELQIEVVASRRGQVFISLDSPSGTNSVLSTIRLDVNPNVPYGWKWGTLATWGEQASGEWTVNIKSNNPNDHLNFFLLRIYGHKSS